MTDKPLFMSEEHVAILNGRLGESGAVLKLCAGLERDLCLLYKLADGPDGKPVWWRTDFTRAGGMRFSLAPGAAAPQVMISGGYWDVLEAVQGKGTMPAPQGEPEAIQKIMALLTSPEVRACAVHVTFPARPIS